MSTLGLPVRDDDKLTSDDAIDKYRIYTIERKANFEAFMAFEEETITTAHAQSVNQINLDEVGDN